jgi:ligand-binding sensor protein
MFNSKLNLKKMAILIKGNGEVIDNYDASDLSKKQKAVGGFIEYVRTDLGMTFCVNEEGLLMGLKPNIIATNLAGVLLLGDVLMINNKEIEREDQE